jgi:hypothetical protein
MSKSAVFLTQTLPKKYEPIRRIFTKSVSKKLTPAITLAPWRELGGGGSFLDEYLHLPSLL